MFGRVRWCRHGAFYRFSAKSWGALYSLALASVLASGCSRWNGDMHFDYYYGQNATQNQNLTTGAAVSIALPVSAPPVPTITSPSTALPLISSDTTITIAGTCEDGDVVFLDGAATAATSCASSSFSFMVSKNLDAPYDFQVSQSDAAGNASPAVSLQWVRDTLSPSAPTVTEPISNPFVSGDTTLTIAGSCETGATVALSGDASAAIACASSTYHFSVSKTTDGTYSFNVTQTDLAGNASVPAVATWNRDTTIPPTPMIASPSSNPAYGNGTSLTLSGSCLSDDTVTLGGDVTADDVLSPAGNLTTTCLNSVYSFTVAKSMDGSYVLTVFQTDPVTFMDSAQAFLTWVRDTVAPPAPAITDPAVNPYTSSANLTIRGRCETGAAVFLSGGESQTVACVSSAYSFTTSTITVDGTYGFTLWQADRAGNISITAVQQWVRNSTVPATPTIAIPTINPLASNASLLTLSGNCETGRIVTLGGDVVAGDVTSPDGSLTTVCLGSTYSFMIAKSLDATYRFTLKQTRDAIDSGTVTLQWTRDTTPPNTAITSAPPVSNPASTASFSFEANESASTFECKLDAQTYIPCTAPVTYSNLANGAHTLLIRATDTAGNVETNPATYAWSQDSNKTVALYHFDAAAETVDSGLYTFTNNNPLTTSGTVSSNATNAKFGTAAENFTSAAPAGSMSAAHNLAQEQARSLMTIETFVKFKSFPATNGAYMILASKTGGVGSVGWVLRLVRKSNNSYYFSFLGSLDGTATTEIKTPNLSLVTGTYYHVALTWNKGAVKIFYNGASKVSGTIGTSGSAILFNSTAPLRLGTDNINANSLDAYFDEFRLSQIVRYSAAFTVPTAAFTSD